MPSLNEQIHGFLALFLCGCALGFLFDLYQGLLRAVRPRRWMITIGDVLFWVGATALIIGALLLSARVELRGYVFMGLISGALFYFWGGSPLVRIGVGKSTSAVIRAVNGVCRAVAKPFTWVWRGRAFMRKSR